MIVTLRAGLLAGLALALAHPALAQPITMEEAVSRALAAAPSLQAQEAGIAGARAGRAQASSRPNPVVSVEAENSVGTGPYSVLGRAETTLSYEQTIERGGKREARIAYADSEIGLAQATARVARLDLAEQVQRAFINLQIAQEVIWLAQSRLDTEHEMQAEALRRVRGYADPLFVETRAAARVTQAELALSEATMRRDAAQAQLASFWGGDPAQVEVTRGIEEPGGRGDAIAQADNALLASSVDRAQAAIAVEQTRATQDYTVSGGVRHFRDSGDVAVVAGFSIPIGRFDRNQGNIDRARAERQRLELEAQAARLALLRELAGLRAEAESARQRANGIMHQVYPLARQTLAQVREGYNRGGFRFSDVQDAADAIIEVQSQWVDAMTRYRDVLSRIDRLTGRFDAVTAPVELIP
jgi:cobalt-zinc-cadmium efflux system outer membrane protein